MSITRRHLIQTTAAASLASLLPRAVFSQGAGNRKAVIHADQEIGVIRPELHSHFAEHLGSCVYGGIWVFAPDGTPLGIIAMPDQPSNLAWGGSDWRTLYITARSSIYRLQLTVPGLREVL